MRILYRLTTFRLKNRCLRSERCRETAEHKKMATDLTSSWRCCGTQHLEHVPNVRERVDPIDTTPGRRRQRFDLPTRRQQTTKVKRAGAT